MRNHLRQMSSGLFAPKIIKIGSLLTEIIQETMGGLFLKMVYFTYSFVGV